MNREECRKALQELDEHRKRQANTKKRISELQTEVIAYFKENGMNRFTSEDICGVLQNQNRRRVDIEELRDDYPDLVEEYTYTSHVEFIKIL